MILVADCMKYGCADTLMRKHRDHVKEENKKTPDVKHVCSEECRSAERADHQRSHDYFDTLKKS